MRDMTFFEQLPQIPFEHGGHRFCAPGFFYDVASITAAFLTPLQRVREVLPSRQMHPLRITPWHALTAITAFDYRDSDVGPYHELTITFPLTLGRSTSVLFGALSEIGEPQTYVHQMPVTTEIARYGGVEFYGYPKYIADIEFRREAGWTTCHFAEGGQDVLTFSGRDLPTQAGQHMLMHPITMRGGRVLRSEFIINAQQIAISRRPSDVQLVLGDHPLADELRALKLGRMIEFRYMPQIQAILTPALESFVS